MSEQKEQGLKPCPFCGNDGSGPIEEALHVCHSEYEWREDGYTIQCDKCTSTMGESDSEEEAIEAWNRRSPALEAQAAENAELRAEVERLEQDGLPAWQCETYEARIARLKAEYLNASKDAQDFMDRALAAETALATAREDAKGREGWKLVPVEPTERMIEMARTCIKRLPEDQRARLLFEDWRTTHGIKMRARWDAMLSASPLSQGGQADG